MKKYKSSCLLLEMIVKEYENRIESYNNLLQRCNMFVAINAILAPQMIYKSHIQNVLKECFVVKANFIEIYIKIGVFYLILILISLILLVVSFIFLFKILKSKNILNLNYDYYNTELKIYEDTDDEVGLFLYFMMCECVKKLDKYLNEKNELFNKSITYLKLALFCYLFAILLYEFF